ncbi:nad dependent epimerase dehydratase [Colletotrichum incanum]|uniref:Nad dependent epimerase dehydratase n=1 Tax=Colletotrichum incanum TaxID=1573173 RepID=A0A167B5H8_COLIC|nr:nad dependent epimerase dehydratase [Colletotrichum incanum]
MPHRVLLTGANGFIAQHILTQFLSAGHSVRAVVLGEFSIYQLQKTFSSYPGSQLDFALVPNITTLGAFDEALISNPPFDVVLHAASPFDFRKGSSNAEFLEPAVKDTTEILSGVVRKAPGVKRVVVTSSTAAIVDIFQSPVQVAEVGDNPSLAYVASKVFTEKAAWALVAENELSYDLATINPPMVYGPLYNASAVKSPQDLNQSNAMICMNLFAPEPTSNVPVPPEVLQLYVDVRDVGQAHLLAATTPGAGENRFIVSTGGASNQKIANILPEKFPELQSRIPKGDLQNTEMPEGTVGLDASLATRVLYIDYRKLEDTIGDMARQVVEIEKRAE